MSLFRPLVAVLAFSAPSCEAEEDAQVFCTDTWPHASSALREGDRVRLLLTATLPGSPDPQLIDTPRFTPRPTP